jgi:hypothetical protein
MITNLSAITKTVVASWAMVCLVAGNGFKTYAQAPNTLGFIPASIEEVDVAFPIYKKWHLTGQADFQMVTQGAYTNNNPFAYVQRSVVRPWLIYNGFPRMKLSLGYAYNHKYDIKEAGFPDVKEQRIILMGSFSQGLATGSFFEQVRFETKFFKDRNDTQRTIPRLRGRIGFNHFIRRNSENTLFATPSISYYTEVMFKFASDDYAPNNFDIFRQCVYFSAGLTDRLHFAAGILGQIQLRTNGNQFDIYYGPTLSFKYDFTAKRQRVTFEDMEGGAD